MNSEVYFQKAKSVFSRKYRQNRQINSIYDKSMWHLESST